MSRNTRFPVAVHILAVLSIKPDEHIGSELIAKSVATNPVVVRRVISLLAKAGLVECQAGANGGSMLCIDPRKTTLLDVYNAVTDQEMFHLHDAHPECPVAVCVKNDLTTILEKAEEKLKGELSRTRLSQVTKNAVTAYKNWKQ